MTSTRYRFPFRKEGFDQTRSLPLPVLTDSTRIYFSNQSRRRFCRCTLRDPCCRCANSLLLLNLARLDALCASQPDLIATLRRSYRDELPKHSAAVGCRARALVHTVACL